MISAANKGRNLCLCSLISKSIYFIAEWAPALIPALLVGSSLLVRAGGEIRIEIRPRGENEKYIQAACVCVCYCQAL